MLARRTKGLFVSPRAYIVVSRNQHLSLLFPARYYSSHSSAGPSADLQKAIAEEARLLQKCDKSIPWYRLAAKYRLSIDMLQSIYNQTEVDAQRRQQQSALVTRAAERHFDSALGLCNWEAIASEFDLPLVECLGLFDAANSTIQPRSLIETYGGWAKADVERLKQFIATNYADSSTVDWRLVGAYMNVNSLECQRVGLGTFNDPLNEASYRRICELRDSGLSWKDVHQYFMQYPNVMSLQGRYNNFKAKLNGKMRDRLTAEWTDVERERMKDLIKRHVESATRSELVDIIKRELPDRPLTDIRLFFDRYAYPLKAGYMNLNQLTRLRELVHEYGDDWGRIGEALDVLPSRARHNWIKHGGDVVVHSGWTANESRQLQHLADSGIKPKEAGKLLGSQHWAYCNKIKRGKPSASDRRVDDLLRSHWADADDETLLKMVDGSALSKTAKWEQVSKALGRSIGACKIRFSAINRKQVADDRKKLVTSEVQGQIGSNSTVDWSQVSQETGLPMRECLELSQYDAGKASWRYDPDSFSQSMVDRMVGFIKEYYPVPVPVNYRAVSNFMWIKMEDCARMHGLLQGKFKWTEAELERAAALRARGLTYKEIARHLSPTLPGPSVCSALSRHLSKPAPEPISADELGEISRLVDEYAGEYPVSEINNKIRTRLNLGKRRGCYSIISSRIAAHSHYRSKIRDIDVDDVASRVSSGQTTIKLVAKELDVPHLTLRYRTLCWNSKLFPPKWTEEEIRKLVDYVQTCNSKPDSAYFSKLLGTKSPMQCSDKIAHLKRMGSLV